MGKEKEGDFESRGAFSPHPHRIKIERFYQDTPPQWPVFYKMSLCVARLMGLQSPFMVLDWKSTGLNICLESVYKKEDIFYSLQF